MRSLRLILSSSQFTGFATKHFLFSVLRTDLVFPESRNMIKILFVIVMYGNCIWGLQYRNLPEVSFYKLSLLLISIEYPFIKVKNSTMSSLFEFFSLKENNCNICVNKAIQIKDSIRLHSDYFLPWWEIIAVNVWIARDN